MDTTPWNSKKILSSFNDILRYELDTSYINNWVIGFFIIPETLDHGGGLTVEIQKHE